MKREEMYLKDETNVIVNINLIGEKMVEMRERKEQIETRKTREQITHTHSRSKH